MCDACKRNEWKRREREEKNKVAEKLIVHDRADK